MTTATPAAPPTKALTKTDQQRVTLRKLFDQQKPELAKLLPRGMDGERLYRIALTECMKNPKLLECTAESWALAMQTCAAQGLYPDSGLGYMYLIPSNNSHKGPDGQWSKRMEVRAQRGYQGDIHLARNTGEIADIYSEVVYAKDTYRVVKGLNRNIEHFPYEGDDDPGPLKAVYAVAKLKSGEGAFVALTRRDVERHKASSKNTDPEKYPDSPWNTSEAAMWRKTAIHELFKWIPKSSEAMQLAAASIANEGRVIETTALDLGSVSLPMEDARPALDALTDRLTGPEKPPRDCPHPSVPPSKLEALSPGKSLVCSDCGEELRHDREPGTEG
jgi:recombination protein RecT